MSESNSVTELLQQLEDDHSEAARQLWDRFFDQAASAARDHLGNLPQRADDEEDIALSAFDALLRGAKERRFQSLENRDDLKQILKMLVKRKAIALMRHADRRGNAVFLSWRGSRIDPSAPNCEAPVSRFGVVLEMTHKQTATISNTKVPASANQEGLVASHW